MALKKICHVIVISGVLSSLVPAAEPELVSVKKIWDQGKHNAFTDLIRWQDKWYCTFREGDAHVGGNQPPLPQAGTIFASTLPNRGCDRTGSKCAAIRGHQARAFRCSHAS